MDSTAGPAAMAHRLREEMIFQMSCGWFDPQNGDELIDATSKTLARLMEIDEEDIPRLDPWTHTVITVALDAFRMVQQSKIL